MALVEFNPGTAQAVAGYTGNVSITIGATSATITPGRDSAASIWAALVDLATVTTCETVQGWATK